MQRRDSHTALGGFVSTSGASTSLDRCVYTAETHKGTVHNGRARAASAVRSTCWTRGACARRTRMADIHAARLHHEGKSWPLGMLLPVHKTQFLSDVTFRCYTCASPKLLLWSCKRTARPADTADALGGCRGAAGRGSP
ncbi:hypothetical protein PLESTB_000445800 [Pleodorina starrii]|uniref:Uncharacterized protein n=1 Tax=Pleodorina starrii TaxID=330485 RepID=A0A9W6F091_9CHLO|nr:hypothetical protein PLESTB_000445800 [Pleodorina starrii]